MTISIFIRTYNEATWLAQCLDKIFSQRIDDTLEVIILDSGSTDETIQIAKQYPVEIYSIPKHLFTYSGALNFGLRQASGNYFVSLSAHAIPYDSLWLAELLKPLNDTSVVASYSRQLPWPEASDTEKDSIEKTFPSTPLTVTLQEINVCRDERALFHLIKYSNVSSAVKRTTALAIGFRSLPFSEDRAFALDCLQRGHSIGYAADSKVYHLHEPSIHSFYQVAKNAEYARFQILKYATQKSLLLASLFLLFKQLIKAILFPVWLLLKIALLLCTQWKKGLLREIQFVIASLGTLFGKLVASIKVLFTLNNSYPNPASIDDTLASVERLK